MKYIIGIVVCIFLFTVLLIPNSYAQNETIEADEIVEIDDTNDTNITNITNITNDTNNTIDDTWYETHWGGDTGNDTFVEPIETEDPIIPSEGGICSGAICTSGSIIVCIGLSFIITKRSSVNYERKEHKDEE